ncbi:MAG: hypothetical protein LUE17_00815, partial [Planctomycetaceae bacterium]|nr:hypothetical protein [Planctomycetaceae bacterium]
MSANQQNPFFVDMPSSGSKTVNPLVPATPVAGGNPFFIGNEDTAPETRQLARLPYGLTPESLGLPEYQAQFLYDRLDDRDKIRTTAAFAGPRAARREAKTLLSERKIDEYRKLEYHENDAGALAMQMGGPYSLEHIEELQKTPEGKKQLREIWNRTQLDNLTAKHAPEYLGFEAGAISGDAAIAMADWRRYVEDTLGGTATLGLGLGKDFAYTGVNYAMTSFTSAVRGTLSNLNFSNEERNTLINSSNHYTEQNLLTRKQRENPDREITADDVAGEFEPIPPVYGPMPPTEAQKVVAKLEQWNNWWDLAMYRPEAKTGSFAYDKIASPLARGLGQVTAAATMAKINAPFAIFSMWGANKEEIRQRILADGGDDEQAEVISSLFAVGSTVIEYSNIDRLLKMTRSSAPMWDFMANKVGMQAVGESFEEGTQSVLG